MNIATVYHQLHKIGFVKSQYEFSKLCGRKKTWFSAIKAANRNVSVSALFTLAQNLKHQAQRPSPVQFDLAFASAQLFKQLEKRCGSATKRS
jgi:hypothetical protein